MNLFRRCGGTRSATSATGRFRSLVPGWGVKLCFNILAGPTVLSAVGACVGVARFAGSLASIASLFAYVILARASRAPFDHDAELLHRALRRHHHQAAIGRRLDAIGPEHLGGFQQASRYVLCSLRRIVAVEHAPKKHGLRFACPQMPRIEPGPFEFQRELVIFERSSSARMDG